MKKTIIIIGDGMSDVPIKELGGKTPLMAASKPSIDRLAAEGSMGLFQTVPAGMEPGSDVANLTVLGYDPSKCSQGRAVLEAASMGIDLGTSDVALRLNLISTESGKIKNHSAGHISSEEGGAIIESLRKELCGDSSHPISIHPGVSYRHLLVLRGWGETVVETAPPHDHVGQSISDLLPKPKTELGARTARFLCDLFHKALPILASHPINHQRRQRGQDQANAIWTWSPGRRPTMETMQKRFGIHGAVISAVDLIRGLGRYAGLDIIQVSGATGLHDTNYEGKAQSAIDALKTHDLVYVHVEATDEASHSRDLALKVKCIEYLDSRVVRPILQWAAGHDLETTIAILPDHPTPVATGVHSREPVPVAIWHSWHRAINPSPQGFDEVQAARGSLGLLVGDQFIKSVLLSN